MRRCRLTISEHPHRNPACRLKAQLLRLSLDNSHTQQDFAVNRPRSEYFKCGGIVKGMLTLLFNRAGAGQIRPDGKRVVARDVARKPVLGHDKILGCRRHWRANLFFSRAYKLFPSTDAAKTSYSLKIRCRFAVQPALILEALAALCDRLVAALSELSPS
jgi:hypothetical protein